MPRLLAFETVARSATASVIASDGRELAFVDLNGRSSEVALVPVLDQLMRDYGQPEALAVVMGPGSFTGLRVGVVAARTFAWMAKIPVYPVDALIALALERGDGLWWPMLSLKRDTTFHAIVRVIGGRPEVLLATVAQADADVPTLPENLEGLIAIGSALTVKPGLVERWRPGTTLGDASALTARGVVLAAAHVEAVPWQQVLPAYHQDAAPVIQRAQQLARSSAPPAPIV